MYFFDHINAIGFIGMECVSRMVYFYGSNGFVRYSLRNILPIRLRVDPYIPLFSPLKGMLYSKQNPFSGISDSKGPEKVGRPEGEKIEKGRKPFGEKLETKENPGNSINLCEKEFLAHAEQYFDHVSSFIFFNFL